MTATARSPAGTARLAAQPMWAGDRASQALGIEIVSTAPGEAVLAMTVSPDMTNGHGTTHGGFIFALADSAFAFACNSYGDIAVAARCGISYVRPGRGSSHGGRPRGLAQRALGDLRRPRDRGAETIAEFRGHSRTVGGS